MLETLGHGRYRKTTVTKLPQCQADQFQLFMQGIAERTAQDGVPFTIERTKQGGMIRSGVVTCVIEGDDFVVSQFIKIVEEVKHRALWNAL